MLLEHRLSALLQLHLHSRLNIWLQGIRQRLPEDSMRIFHVLTFGAAHIRDLTVYWNRAISMRCLSCLTATIHTIACSIDTLRPRQNGRHFADDIFKCIFLNENAWISPMISLKFVPKVRINNIPALVQIMAWRLPGDKPLSEPMMVNLLTHICVTRRQWVKAETKWPAFCTWRFRTNFPQWKFWCFDSNVT